MDNVNLYTIVRRELFLLSDKILSSFNRVNSKIIFFLLELQPPLICRTWKMQFFKTVEIGAVAVSAKNVTKRERCVCINIT